ncbi:MAG: S8 family serine peptidase [Bacteroidetes bacterium]|nr:S8 family serine peptidase [Bacteroidota bacterium]
MENKITRSKLYAFLFLSLVFCLFTSDLFSQYTKYWIQFTDKIGTPYTTSNPSAFLSARSIQRRINQGIAVVQNDLPITPSYINSVTAVPNVTLINRSKWFNAITIYTADTNALNTINNFSFVLNTKPVQRYGRKFGIEENPSPFTSTLKNGNPIPAQYNYGPSYNQINMIGGVCLHNQGFHGEGMVIAILDAGFYKADSLSVFDSLRLNNQILGTWDFVDNDTMVYDAHPHGSWVLSTLGGNLPGQIVGTAPKANYWLFRTEQAATEYVIEEDNWVSGAEYADSVGADVLSTSLGYTEFDDTTQNHTYADMDGNTARISIGTDMAVSKGMFAVCSAGNSGWSAWHFIGAPADADSVLAVGAVDSLKNYAGFSSTGPSFDGRVKPNVAAQGQDAVVSDLATGITYLSGTSFSGPITAGVVACLWQAHPTATNMQLFNAIEQTASQYNNPDSLLGYGISDFCAANNALGVFDNASSSLEIFNVYPNPFQTNISFLVQGTHSNIQSLQIDNLLGEKVFQTTLNSKQGNLNLSFLPRGVYVLSVKAEGRSYSSKLVKY